MMTYDVMGQPSFQPSSRSSRHNRVISTAVKASCDGTMDATACHAALQLFCTLSSTGSTHASCAYAVLLGALLQKTGTNLHIFETMLVLDESDKCFLFCLRFASRFFAPILRGIQPRFMK